jgi:predicted Zn-dependent protease
MNMSLGGMVVAFILASWLAATSALAPADNKKPDVFLSSIERELKRAQSELGKANPPPYYLSYTIRDQTSAAAVGILGDLASSFQTRRRTADVITRIGSPALDNTHQESRRSAIHSGTLPLDDDADAISRELWLLTYRGYRDAARAYETVKTKTQVNAKEEDTSADFSQESPVIYAESQALPSLPEQKVLERLARQYSAVLAKYPFIYSSTTVVSAQSVRSYFISTEGSRVITGSMLLRIAIQAETRADDGMELFRVETFQARSLGRLPKDAEVSARVEKMAADLKSLRSAPVAEPFDGPAMLSGKAAAVFLHEVLGHRIEGQRQRGESEGQTFAKKINQQVLPEFLSVVDDPTEHDLNGADLSGSYKYDDEGIGASRVEVVKDGILKNFLMARMPVQSFQKSNGHGRGQAGLMPVGRQGNLIVTSSRMVSDAELRQDLIAEVKKQGKPYGLFFEDIQGGFTLTQRTMPQAFQVLPVLVWRVYLDGRPDELVRGVDIVGTPLSAMNRILVTGKETAVFNGICVAESGGVPVSAAAPAMLFSEIEVQKRGHTLQRPPILAPPGFEPKTPPRAASGKASR